MIRPVALLLTACATVGVPVGAQRSQLFDNDWKFFRGDIATTQPAVHCPASAFPSSVGRCEGLKKVVSDLRKLKMHLDVDT